MFPHVLSYNIIIKSEQRKKKRAQNKETLYTCAYDVIIEMQNQIIELPVCNLNWGPVIEIRCPFIKCV